MSARRPAREWMVQGPEVYGDNESRQTRRECQLNKAGLSISVRRGGFVVKEPVEEMPYKVGKLATLRFTHRTHRRLHIERENGGPGNLGNKESLETVSHGRSA